MRITDILTFVSDRIIAQADNGFLYWAKPYNPDPFQALKRATLDPGIHTWKIWDLGSDTDLEEVTGRLKEEARQKFSWPCRVIA